MDQPDRSIAPRKLVPRRDRADTLATLHMWRQVVGKIRMARMPALNHWWHVPLYVSPRGLTTGSMPYGERLFQLEFDFVDHRLAAEDSDGRSFSIDLVPMSVATADLRRYAERLGLDLERFAADLADPAVAARVERDVESGEQSGVDGTPSLFIDGRRYRGPRDTESLGRALAASFR